MRLEEDGELIRRGVQQKEVTRMNETGPIEGLTHRELEILSLLAQALSNKGVAAQLNLSERTVRNHMTDILGKLGLHNRTQAAIWARERELGAEK